MESTIQIAVRIRPKHAKEEFKQELAEHDCNTIRLINSDKYFEGTYTQVFSTSATQEEIYAFVAPTLDKSEQGLSSSIIAYGQTGSGKTYTMFGTETSPGIVYRSGSHILRNVGKDFTVTFSMIQIYNEKIFDMLQDVKLTNPLYLRQDPIFGMYVQGLTEYVVDDPQDVNELVKRGHVNRMTRDTHLSINSSRSHCICQFSLESNSPNNEGNIKRAKVNLIDLAGSERMLNATVFKSQVEEMKIINKSLSTLGNVISILASKNSKFVPYRDSKLTFLLKDSLQGKTGITFIATISPTIETAEESIQTLRFAKKAKEVSISPEKTEISMADNKLIQRLQKEIRYLKDCMKVPKDSETLHQKLFILQEENERLKEGLGVNMDKILEENRQMKEKLKKMMGETTNSLVPETDELDKFCEKYQPIPAASTTSSSFRQTTPNAGRYIENRILEVRIRKNPNLVEKRTASLHKTLERIDKERLESEEIALKNKRFRTLNQIQQFRESKAKEAMEKFEKAKIIEEGLVKKLETGKLQQFSEVCIKTFRDIDEAKKISMKAELEKEKALQELNRVKQRGFSRSPLRSAATQQIFIN